MLFPGEGRGPVAMSFERFPRLTNCVDTGPLPSPGN